MFTDTQVFWNNFTATGAHLRCVLGINERNTPTSLCRFVRGELHELTPGYIRNTPVNDLVPIGLHTLDIQVLKAIN
jgi:hypothetical protein